MIIEQRVILVSRNRDIDGVRMTMNTAACARIFSRNEMGSRYMHVFI
ncbi:hypothetical protein CGLO_13203 [Colletotrichum gloeosporioides Cg-14]|uniref:Uncharacterized protein n=1 Tax=Colletotrichum gloeosporioides (strain Cg-14) TaxID=1237896 RepID=T0LHH2_COLGC|nr:hypothetical protein CGLO_13203 [Colletotrichum gloeosporioides Cg-14]